MANQPEVIQWDTGVYQIEVTDPVDGGVGATTNKPLLNLANRTAWLKKHVDDLESGAFKADWIAPKNSPALTGSPTAPTAALGDNSTKIANTAFVQGTVNGVTTKSVAGGVNVTLTAVEAGAGILVFTGALTANIAVIVPAVTGHWIVENRTTGNFTLTLKTAAGAGVAITQGKTLELWCDGSKVIQSTSDFANTALTGTPTAPTAPAGTSTTQVATTAFVANSVSDNLATDAESIARTSKTKALTPYGLGLNVQSDPSDTTSGKFLTPGAFGLGSANGIVGDQNILNNVINGIYRSGSADTGKPDGTSTGSSYFKFGWGSTYYGLLYASPIRDAFYMRTVNNGSANAWKEIMHVGHSGLGASGAGGGDNFPGSDLSAVNVGAGIYYVPETIGEASNLPFGFTTSGYTSGTVFHRQSGTRGGQIYVSTNGRMAWRGRSGSTPTDWLEAMHVGMFGLGGGTASPPNGRNSVNPFGWYYSTQAVTWGGGSFFLDMPYSTSQNAGLRLSTDPYTDNFYLQGGVSGQKTYRQARRLWHDGDFDPATKADLASPSLTGTPTAPTATAGTNNTQLATTAFAQGIHNGRVSVTVTTANVTLTAAQAGVGIINLTGALTGHRNVIVPAASGQWIFHNNTTGNFNVTVKTASGAGVVLPKDLAVIVYCDGTNVWFASSSSKNSFQTFPFSPAAGTTTLTIVGGYTPGNILVEKNGALLQPAEYTATNGTTITVAATKAGDTFTVYVYSSFDVANAVPLSGGNLAGPLTGPASATESAAGMVKLATAAIAQGLAHGTDVLTPKTLDDAFRGGNQIIASNGFQKLPGGLIKQWLAVNLTIDEGQFLWPLVFPNNVLSASVVRTTATRPSTTSVTVGVSVSKTAIHLRKTIEETVGGSLTFLVEATGY